MKIVFPKEKAESEIILPEIGLYKIEWFSKHYDQLLEEKKLHEDVKDRLGGQEDDSMHQENLSLKSKIAAFEQY